MNTTKTYNIENITIEALGVQQLLPNVTRVEVIDSSGRSYVKYDVSDVFISLQDNERTLKVFLKNGQE